jgi:hypothetical protein
MNNAITDMMHDVHNAVGHWQTVYIHLSKHINALADARCSDIEHNRKVFAELRVKHVRKDCFIYYVKANFEKRWQDRAWAAWSK